MKLVLDTSIWVKALKAPPASRPANEPDQAQAVELCDDIVARGKHKVVVPATVLTEIVGGGARGLGHLWESDPGHKARSREETANSAGNWSERFREWVMRSPSVQIVDVTAEFGFKAGICARLLRLRGMDALVAYAAIAHGHDLVATDGELLNVPKVLSTLTRQQCGTNWAIDIFDKARAITVRSLADYPWPDMETPEVPNG